MSDPEWTMIPQYVCRVTGTIYHEACQIDGDTTRYPCCNRSVIVEAGQAIAIDIPDTLP